MTDKETDKELLELAAKAAGFDLSEAIIYPGKFGVVAPFKTSWNPLYDDGDAFRLIVKLGLCIGPNFDGDTAVAFGKEVRNICEDYSNDPYAATRRAITRAAAEIGKAMP